MGGVRGEVGVSGATIVDVTESVKKYKKKACFGDRTYLVSERRLQHDVRAFLASN